MIIPDRLKTSSANVRIHPTRMKEVAKNNLLASEKSFGSAHFPKKLMVYALFTPHPHILMHATGFFYYFLLFSVATFLQPVADVLTAHS